MVPGNVNLLQDGLDRLQAGDHQGAARIFVRLLRQNPHSEEAWLYLADCLTSPRQKRDCLERVLRMNPWNGEARAALEDVEQAVPSLECLLEEAVQSEGCFDYTAAYELYSQAAALDPGCFSAWVGKGFSAGMLSTPTHNRVREFFDCLTRALEQIPVTGGARPGSPSPAHAAAAQLPADLAARLTYRMCYLADHVSVLTESCSPDMANIYTVERVRLADWAFYVARQTGLQHCPTYTREQMLFIAGDSFRSIAARINRGARSQRARHELLQTFKLFLLSNLSLSELNKDAELLGKLEQIKAV